MAGGGFDVIIGNPPYVERAKFDNSYRVRALRTEASRDIYAWLVERAVALSAPSGRQALIVPVSIVSSASFQILRDVLAESAPSLWLAHFANRPGQLFVGAQNRLTIFVRARAPTPGLTFSTRYHRWDARNGERDSLFGNLHYLGLHTLARSFHGLYPKVGVAEATALLQKIANPRTVTDHLVRTSKYPLYWVRVPGYFCQFFLAPPLARPEKGGPARVRGEVKEVFGPDDRTRRLLHALLNSSVYYQFFCAYTDGRHINPSDVADFPLDLARFTETTIESLLDLSQKLERAMSENTTRWRKSGLLIDSVDSRLTKAVLNEIDQALAEQYRLTDDELDFLINYDIKYRMGGREDDDEE
jgi:hypothetical protein